MFKLFLFYLIIINFIGFIIIYIDKRKAIQKEWRIREKTLFLITYCFGSLGIFLGMYTFRHKTKHLKFILGVPLILSLQIYLIYKIYITLLL